MKESYILSIDQGTTSSRAIIFKYQTITCKRCINRYGMI